MSAPPVTKWSKRKKIQSVRSVLPFLSLPSTPLTDTDAYHHYKIISAGRSLSHFHHFRPRREHQFDLSFPGEEMLATYDYCDCVFDYTW